MRIIIRKWNSMKLIISMLISAVMGFFSGMLIGSIVKWWFYRYSLHKYLTKLEYINESNQSEIDKRHYKVFLAWSQYAKIYFYYSIMFFLLMFYLLFSTGGIIIFSLFILSSISFLVAYREFKMLSEYKKGEL